MHLKNCALLFTLVFSMAAISGCDKAKEISAGIGETISTRWFEYTVHSVDKVNSYAGYESTEDYQLYSVLVTLNNTFDTIIPMGTFDFYMDDPIFYEYVWPLDPLDDTMMPENFDLRPGQSVQYHMIFEIPVGVSKLELIYTEIDSSDKEGNTYKIMIGS
ncbi:MAG: DUF4352 domain-containing protein [Treponema sp.]|nr:DUF4352 domain-containing protein [Treponema sp.]